VGKQIPALLFPGKNSPSTSNKTFQQKISIDFSKEKKQPFQNAKKKMKCINFECINFSKLYTFHFYTLKKKQPVVIQVKSEIKKKLTSISSILKQH